MRCCFVLRVVICRLLMSLSVVVPLSFGFGMMLVRLIRLVMGTLILGLIDVILMMLRVLMCFRLLFALILDLVLTMGLHFAMTLGLLLSFTLRLQVLSLFVLGFLVFKASVRLDVTPIFVLSVVLGLIVIAMMRFGFHTVHPLSLDRVLYNSNLRMEGRFVLRRCIENFVVWCVPDVPCFSLAIESLHGSWVVLHLVCHRTNAYAQKGSDGK